MVQNNKYDVWVGSELGLLKGVTLSSGQFDNYGETKALDKSQAITSMSTNVSQVLVGLKDGSMKQFDSNLFQYSSDVLCCGSTPVRGIVATPDGMTLTCTEDGLLKQWKENNCLLEKKIGSSIETMVANSSSTLVAGGGEENDLKIWKVEDMEKPVFTARNVKNDFLNLRVPVWITAIRFFKDSDNEIVTGTGNHNIRVYDTRVKRRPVVDFEFHEHPITAMTITGRNKSVIVGNSAGYMSELDITSGREIGAFKGNAGSIRDIRCHAVQPFVVSCGLDRILKVYDLSTRTLEKKIYMKSNLNCIHVSDEELVLSVKVKEEDEIEKSKDADEEEKDGEEMWDNMQVISEKRRKKNP